MDDKRLPPVDSAGNPNAATTMIARAAVTLWYYKTLLFSNPWIHDSFRTSADPQFPFPRWFWLFRCHYYVEGGWGWVVLSASVVSTLLTYGCQWTIVYYLSHSARPPAITNWPSSILQKGRHWLAWSFSFLFFDGSIRPSGVKRPMKCQYLTPHPRRRAQQHTIHIVQQPASFSPFNVDKWQSFAAWYITVWYWNPVCQAWKLVIQKPTYPPHSLRLLYRYFLNLSPHTNKTQHCTNTTRTASFIELLMWNAQSLKVRSAPRDLLPRESQVLLPFFNKSKKRKKSCFCIYFSGWKMIENICVLNITDNSRAVDARAWTAFFWTFSRQALPEFVSVCTVYAACSTDWQERWFDVRPSRRKQTSHEEERRRVSVSR